MDHSKSPQVLIDGTTVRRRITELAGQVAADHGEEPPVVIGILNGAVPFMMELIQALPAAWTDRLDFDFIDASSYHGTESTGRVRLSRDPVVDIAGRAVLLVDGIVDTGHTLAAALTYLDARHPRQVRVCALLDKPGRRQVGVTAHYRGFAIDDVFVVGYGMDLDQRYRSLRYVGVLGDNGRS